MSVIINLSFRRLSLKLELGHLLHYSTSSSMNISGRPWSHRRRDEGLDAGTLARTLNYQPQQNIPIITTSGNIFQVQRKEPQIEYLMMKTFRPQSSHRVRSSALPVI